MAKARLLQAACTVAMLAAAPAFAQTSAPGANTGSAAAPTTHEAMPGNTASTGGGGTMPHHGKMMRRSGGMHSAKGADAQDAAVDRLNEQSYQASQQGQTFTAPGSGGGTTAPSGSSSQGTSGGKM